MTEDARVTQASRPLIDLIVAKRNGLISTAGIFALLISDNPLLFATCKIYQIMKLKVLD